MTPNTLVYNKIFQQYTQVYAVPLPVRILVRLNRTRSQAAGHRALGLSREKRLTSGRPWPFEQFFRVKSAQKQIELARPPARPSVRVGRRPRKSTGVDPD
jgi:hypothetical protein